MRGEIRLAVRRFAHEPALAVAAALTLALGIGACTAMFSIVEAVLLKPMDVTRPGQLVVMWPLTGDTAGEFTFNGYRELARPSASLERVALTGSVNWPIPTDILLPDGRRARGTQCAVSDTFFDALGARPLLGRTFRPGDDRPGAPLTLVVSWTFWRARLGGDPAVVGRMLTIGQDRWQVIGVMPPEFFYPSGADLWTPAATLLALTTGDGTAAGLEQVFDSVGAFHVIARLRPGVSPAQAQADATRRWQAMPGTPQGASARVATTAFLDHVFGSARHGLWLLLAAVCLVLLIACANVAGLLAARNALRTRETAVRLALGASRWQIARLSLVEASVLATAGALLGTALAAVMLPALIRLTPAGIVRFTETRIDSVVLGGCVLITAAVTFAIGLMPATHVLRPARTAAAGAFTLRDPGRGAVRSRTRRVLLVGQVAGSVTLLVASALVAQSFLRLAALDPGFDATNVLTIDLSRLDQSRYPTYATRHQLLVDLAGRLEALPGVRSAAAVLNRPFAHGVIGWDSGLLREGQTDVAATWLANPVVNFETVTPRYFETMGIPLRRGRVFASGDRAGAAPVAIVSGNLAERLWPRQDPLGKRLVDSFGRGKDGRPPRWLTVVGIVGEARYREIERPRFDLYVPLAQVEEFDPETMVVKTSAPARTLVPAAATVLSSIDPQLTAADVGTMEDVVARVRAPWRFNMQLFGAFGGMSIALTIIGVIALMVSTVNWRRREIGVRVALGARARQVVTLIAVEGAQVIGAGVAAGLLISVLASRLLSGLLFGVAPTDFRTLAGVAAAVLAAGLLAAYLPARRAAALDPCDALREE